MDSNPGSPQRSVDSEIRVRYAETDAEGVVYYANHFVYMEVARVNLLRGLGLDLNHWQQQGRGIVIVEATCRYRSPARFDDVLTVRAWVQSVRRSSFTIAYEIWHCHGPRLVAEGHTVQVLVQLSDMRPIALPAEILAAVGATQAQQPP